MLKRYPQIFKTKLKILKQKFSKANFLLRFINSLVAQFNNNTHNDNERNEKEEMIIPPQLFEIRKKTLFLQVAFCEANEKRSKSFLNKFYNFTIEKFKFIVRRGT